MTPVPAPKGVLVGEGNGVGLGEAVTVAVGAGVAILVAVAVGVDGAEQAARKSKETTINFFMCVYRITERPKDRIVSIINSNRLVENPPQCQPVLKYSFENLMDRKERTKLRLMTDLSEFAGLLLPRLEPAIRLVYR